MSVYCCDHLSSCCGMVTASIRCIPCTGEDSQARSTGCCIAQQVHSCSTAVIGCCRSREYWCCRTIYCCISACLANSWCMSVYCRDHLRSCCRVITASICCIPCTGEYSQARSTGCCIAQQVHSCPTAIIGCCWRCEHWCCCTIYRCITTCFTDAWCMSVYCCDHLRSCCRVITTSIRCIPRTGENSQARSTGCCIAQQVHRSSTAIIGCCRRCEYWCSCTIYRCITTCITNRWCMSVYRCDHL